MGLPDRREWQGQQLISASFADVAGNHDVWYTPKGPDDFSAEEVNRGQEWLNLVDGLGLGDGENDGMHDAFWFRTGNNVVFERVNWEIFPGLVDVVYNHRDEVFHGRVLVRVSPDRMQVGMMAGHDGDTESMGAMYNQAGRLTEVVLGPDRNPTDYGDFADRYYLGRLVPFCMGDKGIRGRLAELALVRGVIDSDIYQRLMGGDMDEVEARELFIKVSEVESGLEKKILTEEQLQETDNWVDEYDGGDVSVMMFFPLEGQVHFFNTVWDFYSRKAAQVLPLNCREIGAKKKLVKFAGDTYGFRVWTKNDQDYLTVRVRRADGSKKLMRLSMDHYPQVIREMAEGDDWADVPREVLEEVTIRVNGRTFESEA